MPIEQEMVPRDKYTIFDRKEKKYRKSIRSKFFPASPGKVSVDGLDGCLRGNGILKGIGVLQFDLKGEC